MYRTKIALRPTPAAAPATETSAPFGEVAQRELAPRRAERDADRGLAGADHGSRQQQRGDVGAGNEQQEPGAAEQDQQRGAKAVGCRLAKGGHVRRVEPIPLRIRRGDDGGDPLHVCPRLFQRDARFASGVRKVPLAATVRVARRRHERNPHLGVAAPHAQAGDRQSKRRWHHAAHGVAPLVERDGAADDVALAAKAPPERARDDGAAVVGEPLAEERWTELSRQGGRHRRAGDELRLARRRQMESAAAEPAERVEARGLLLVVLQLGNRHRHERARRCSCSCRTATRSARCSGRAAAAAARR